MGKINNVHITKDQGKPDPYQSIGATDDQTID
jgi:hypothetical protein